MSQAQAVHFYDKDGIATPLGALLAIVVNGIGRGNTADTDVFNPLVYRVPAIGAKAPQYQGTTRGQAYIVMVGMFVGHKDGIHTRNGRYRVACASAGRVYKDFCRLRRGKKESAVAQPLYLDGGFWCQGRGHYRCWRC